MVEGVLVIKKGREKYGIIRYHSIPTETVYQSARIQAFRQSDNLFRSIDSVSQTLLIIPLKKCQKMTKMIPGSYCL